MSSGESEYIEMGFPEPGGYERLAGYMGQHPELGILRRFGALGFENLLYLQAEITRLEVRLRIVQARDRKSDDERRKRYGRAWIELSRSAGSGDPDTNREQYDLIMRLRVLMDQYEKAVYYRNKTLSLRKPHRKLLEDLREWMNRPALGRIAICSSDWKTWEPNKEIEDDLFTFENSSMDEFTSLVTYTAVDIYHKIIGRHIHQKRSRGTDSILPLSYANDRHPVTYSHKAIARFTRTITVLIACMLPIGAILLLYTVNDMTTRLEIIACLTGIFSISMNLFTMASLSEIFGATAAFAAVLVVFLSAADGA